MSRSLHRSNFQEREKQFPEVMADSRARKGQDKSRISYCTQKQQSAQIVISQKDTDARLKDFH